LNTNNLDRIVQFYTENFGFVEDMGFRQKPGVEPSTSTTPFGELVGTGFPDRSIMLRMPGDVVRLEIFEWAGERFEERSRAFNGGGIVRLGFLTDDIDADLAKLRERGVDVFFEDGEVTNLN
jgi:4-hydroxyphenylpyruvate dioxygenase-like putative hemolysin